MPFTIAGFNGGVAGWSIRQGQNLSSVLLPGYIMGWDPERLAFPFYRDRGVEELPDGLGIMVHQRTSLDYGMGWTGFRHIMPRTASTYHFAKTFSRHGVELLDYI